MPLSASRVASAAWPSAGAGAGCHKPCTSTGTKGRDGARARRVHPPLAHTACHVSHGATMAPVAAVLMWGSRAAKTHSEVVYVMCTFMLCACLLLLALRRGGGGQRTAAASLVFSLHAARFRCSGMRNASAWPRESATPLRPWAARPLDANTITRNALCTCAEKKHKISGCLAEAKRAARKKVSWGQSGGHLEHDIVFVPRRGTASRRTRRAPASV